jgi:hypothetical protein
MSTQTIKHRSYSLHGSPADSANVHTLIAYTIIIMLLGMIAFGIYALSKGGGSELTKFADKTSEFTNTLPNLLAK